MAKRMSCPMCGAEMNHHADKLIEPRSADEARLVNAALGGIVEETHGCPACGNVVSRRAGAEAQAAGAVGRAPIAT